MAQFVDYDTQDFFTSTGTYRKEASEFLPKWVEQSDLYSYQVDSNCDNAEGRETVIVVAEQFALSKASYDRLRAMKKSPSSSEAVVTRNVEKQQMPQNVLVRTTATPGYQRRPGLTGPNGLAAQRPPFMCFGQFLCLPSPQL